MKFTAAFIALTSLLAPSVLAEDFVLFATTHERSWQLDIGRGTYEYYNGPVADVKLVDGEGEQLNVIWAYDFNTEHQDANFVINYLADKSDRITCSFKKAWPEEKFNVGDITMIITPKPADPCSFEYDLRTRQSEGNAALLDPLRFEGECSYMKCLSGSVM